MRIVLLIVAITLIACTKPNPNLCCVDASDCATVGLEEVKGCDDGLLCRGNQCIAEVCETSAECDADAPYCVLIPDGRCQEACTDDIQCPGFGESVEQTFCEAGACVECRTSESDCTGATPVCDDGRCVACVRNQDCASGVCIEDGTCANTIDVAYVSTSGATSGECLETSPCDKIEFALALTPERPFIVIESGTYTRAGTLALLGSRRLIGRGPTRPVLRRSTDGPIVTLQNVAEIGLEELEISGATGTAGPGDPTLGHGVLCPTGSTGGTRTVKLVDSVVRGNAVHGVRAQNCTVDAFLTRFAENGSSGVSMTDSASVFDRCVVEDNVERGAFFDVGIYVVTNSIIARNGRVGLELFASSGSRAEFNTIVDNANTGTLGQHAGFFCNAPNIAFSNNIVSRNRIQTSGSGCTFPDSIIIDTDITPLNFVSPDVAPFDYHIQAGSIAIDAAGTTTLDHDFDGQPRPASGADVGADEL
jgi:hypothetical protein